MTRKTKLLISIAAIALAGGVIARNALIPPTNSIPVKATKTAAKVSFDHSHKVLDEILKAQVKNERVNYKALKADPSKLTAYLGNLAAVEESEFDRWSEEQQLAMLINLYNAATLKLIVDHYPVKSIKKIGGLLKKPWDIESLNLFGKATTLDHLEHGILRKKYSEPRIHFAIVCAAKGCPALRPGAFTAEKLDAQLKEQGEKFIRDPQKNRVDAADETVYVSEIFKWFKQDFTKDGSVIDFVRPYFSPADAKALDDDFKVKHTDYDWSINDQ